MKKTKSFIAVLAVALLTLSAFAGCTKEETKTTVRLNEVVHSVFYAPQYVALEEGFFADEGLDIELTAGQGADKSMTALISKSADIALLGTEAGIYVYNEGKDNYAMPFAQLTQRAGNFLVSRVDEPDFDWEDIKGKSVIGGRVGGMPELVLEYVLKSRGIEPGKDMEIINNIAFTSTSGAFAHDILGSPSGKINIPSNKSKGNFIRLIVIRFLQYSCYSSVRIDDKFVKYTF